MSVCMTQVFSDPKWPTYASEEPNESSYSGRTRLHSFWSYYHLGYNVSTFLPFLFWSWYKETLFSLKNVDNLRSNLPCTKIHASICRHSEGVMGTDFSPIAAIVSTVALDRRILLASLILDMEIGLSLPIANSSRPISFQNHI